MHLWVKRLQKILPIVFFGFIALLVVMYRSNVRKDRPEGKPVISKVRPGDRPEIESFAFDDTQTVGGKAVSRIRARRTISFSSGWNTLEDVHLTIYRDHGQTYDLVCPIAEFHAETKEAKATGGVKITASDGMEFTTHAINYKGNRLLNKIPVQFRIDRWRGSAGGLDLSVQYETLKLTDRVQVSMEAPKVNEPEIALTAQQAVFSRKTNEVTFEDDVEVRRAMDTLFTDRILARSDANRQRLTALDGYGNVDVRLSGASSLANAETSTPNEDRKINAERFYVEFGPAGEARAIIAKGEKAMARATLLGPPRRDITARQFRVGVEGSLVKEMRADGEVRVEEPAPASRVLTANTIILFFHPATRQVDSAVVDGEIHYRDPRNEARGEHANYWSNSDTVAFTSVPGSAPSVTTDGHQLKANKIEFSPKQGMIRANGNVVARLNAKQKTTSASETALFPDASGPVFVNAESLIIRQTLKIAIFSGNVRAWQGTNTLFADEMQVQGAGDSLQARGKVRSLLYNARGGTRKSPMSIKANQLTAKKSERRIDLEGAVEIEDEGRKLDASRAVVFLDAARKIERVEATGGVVLTERATGRKGTGERVDYRVTQRMIYLEGKPAELTEARGSIKGSRVVFDMAKNKVDVVSGESPTEATYIPD